MNEVEELQKKTYTFKNRKPKIQRSREEWLAYRKGLYLKNKERIKAENRRWRDKNEKRHKDYTKKYKEENKEIIRERSKVYFEKNKDIIAKKMKDFREKDLEKYNARTRELRAKRTPEQKVKYAEYKKRYDIEHKEEIKNKNKISREKGREKRRQYHAKRYRTDINYKLVHNLRSRIKNVYRGNKKSDKSISLLGCTVSHLRNHIKSLFTEGMTWELFLEGKIHVDHVKPCAKFDLSKPEQQKECFNWRNLQPLWAVDNLIKGAKYEERKVA